MRAAGSLRLSIFERTIQRYRRADGVARHLASLTESGAYRKGVLPKSRTAAVSVLRPAAAAQNRRYYSNSRTPRSRPRSLFRVSGVGQRARKETLPPPQLWIGYLEFLWSLDVGIWSFFLLLHPTK